jgi:hypothetical protein
VALPSTSISPPCLAPGKPEVNHSGLRCAEGLTGTLRIQGLKSDDKSNRPHRCRRTESANMSAGEDMPCTSFCWGRGRRAAGFSAPPPSLRWLWRSHRDVVTCSVRRPLPPISRGSRDSGLGSQGASPSAVGQRFRGYDRIDQSETADGGGIRPDHHRFAGPPMMRTHEAHQAGPVPT